MDNGYQSEIDEFLTQFKEFQDKKIILYGLGRYTATLLAGLDSYQFIGLLDRNEENIGKIIYGLPVISLKQAEETGDLIVINTAEGYWNTILRRLEGVNIPIYFRNGERAVIREQEKQRREEPYWNSSEQELLALIEDNDVVTFDIYDTLITRKVFYPQDIFGLVERRLVNNLSTGFDFAAVRMAAESGLNGQNPSLDEIYQEINNLSGCSQQILEQAKKLELSVEREMTVPRKSMIKLCNKALEDGKEVFLISDMYLPVSFFKTVLERFGLKIEESRIWVSGILKMSKKDGNLWKRLKSFTGNGKKVLHIGDNEESDIRNAQKEGFHAYRIMSGAALLGLSSMEGMVAKVRNLYSSLSMGTIIARLLNNPFRLNAENGDIRFEDEEEFGYCVFGPVILTFLLWVIEKAHADGIANIVFPARDGFFLLEDFNFLKELIGEWALNGKYLLISRRQAAIASISSYEDFTEVVRFPFQGTFREYMYDRFDIQIPQEEDGNAESVLSAVSDWKKILLWMKPYKAEIYKNISAERYNFRTYLANTIGEEDFVFIDLWYYGHTQYYLSKILERNLTGYYFTVNCSDKNICRKNNTFIPCFQKDGDPEGKKSAIYRYDLVVESFLTAPYGMIKKVDGTGQCKYEDKRKNQIYFHTKERINRGVKRYIKEMAETGDLHSKSGYLNAPLFVDELFEAWMTGGQKPGESIRNSFYYDNGMNSREEYKIFE